MTPAVAPGPDALTPAVAPGPDAAPVAPAAADAAPACVVCGFVARSIERRAFFIAAEAMGEPWFLAGMRRGGYCVRHARPFVDGDAGLGLTQPLRELVVAWRAGHRASSPGSAVRVGDGCPICTTAAWADQHAVATLAGPDPVNARATLGHLEPVCLGHLDRLLDAVPRGRLPEVVAMIRGRLEEVPRGTLGGAIGVLAGDDLDGPLRKRPDAGVTGVPVALPEGVTADAIDHALARGACPLCEAADAAARWPVAMLAAPPPRHPDLRDLDRLCVRHLHDAAYLAPGAARQAVVGSLRSWTTMLEALPTAGEIAPAGLAARTRWLARRPRTDSGRSSRRSGGSMRAALETLASPDLEPRRGLVAARRRRTRACVACEAASTAVDRSATLLGALLARRPAAERYEASMGVCLRHLPALTARASAAAAETVVRVADARAARLAWELEESTRRSSWSVRFEPKGPEGDAWRRALVFVLGEAVLRSDLLGPDGDPVGPAA